MHIKQIFTTEGSSKAGNVVIMDPGAFLILFLISDAHLVSTSLHLLKINIKIEREREIYEPEFLWSHA